jgi:hypothetical protein
MASEGLYCPDAVLNGSMQCLNPLTSPIPVTRSPNSRTCRRTSVSFTLDCYGHLYPESDAALRDRLDAIYSAGQRDQGAGVVELLGSARAPARPGTQVSGG